MPLRRLLICCLLFALLLPALPLHGQDSPPAPTFRWKRADPASHNMDAMRLAELPNLLINQNMGYVHAILVARGGAIVYESYQNGYGRDDLLHIRSITKSLMAALIGIALERGDLPGLDMRLGDYLPEYFQDEAQADHANITLRDLMMMRSGINWPEDGEALLGLWQSERDQLAYILSQPMLGTPGSVWTYSTADAHLISALFTRATGQTLAAYAEAHLFGPLGIRDYRWQSDAAGFSIGGTALELRAEDVARLGLLYLDGGYWGGRQLLSPEWVAFTLTPQPYPNNYASLWWIRQPDSPYYDYPHFYGIGFGGQLLYVYPTLDLIIVVLNDHQQQTREGGFDQARATQALVRDAIIPAVLDAAEVHAAALAPGADADVDYVRASRADDGRWHFEVTLRHPDKGWEDYADGWDVVLPDGTVLLPDPAAPFTRPLLHPHENEQPFTRSQGGLLIPAGVTAVRVRAHDSLAGWGGREVSVYLDQDAGRRFEVWR